MRQLRAFACTEVNVTLEKLESEAEINLLPSVISVTHHSNLSCFQEIRVGVLFVLMKHEDVKRNRTIRRLECNSPEMRQQDEPSIKALKLGKSLPE